MEDITEQGDKTMNGNPEFSFVAPWAPVTTTKMVKNSNLLKRSINDLPFIPGWNKALKMILK